MRFQRRRRKIGVRYIGLAQGSARRGEERDALHGLAAARLRAPNGAMVICTETASFYLFGLSLRRGTEGSNPFPSSAESCANPFCWRRARRSASPPMRMAWHLHGSSSNPPATSPAALATCRSCRVTLRTNGCPAHPEAPAGSASDCLSTFPMCRRHPIRFGRADFRVSEAPRRAALEPSHASSMRVLPPSPLAANP